LAANAPVLHYEATKINIAEGTIVVQDVGMADAGITLIQDSTPRLGMDKELAMSFLESLVCNHIVTHVFELII